MTRMPLGNVPRLLSMNVDLRKEKPYPTGRHNLAVHLLDLPEFGSEVPELGPGHHFIRGEDVHLEKRRGRSLLGRQAPSNDLKLFELGSKLNRVRTSRIAHREKYEPKPGEL